MAKYIYLEKELAENTTYKSIKNAYQSNDLTIVYFPRENVYYFETAPIAAKTVDLIQKELQRLYPGIKKLQGA